MHLNPAVRQTGYDFLAAQQKISSTELAVLENYSWQNVHISGWLAAEFSPAGRFEEKYAAGSFR